MYFFTLYDENKTFYACLFGKQIQKGRVVPIYVHIVVEVHNMGVTLGSNCVLGGAQQLANAKKTFIYSSKSSPGACLSVL